NGNGNRGEKRQHRDRQDKHDHRRHDQQTEYAHDKPLSIAEPIAESVIVVEKPTFVAAVETHSQQPTTPHPMPETAPMQATAPVEKHPEHPEKAASTPEPVISAVMKSADAYQNYKGLSAGKPLKQ